jgi:TPR repeat protein
MKRLFFPIIIVALLFTGCVHYGSNPNARYYLSKARLKVVEREAFEGDNAAANRMGDYYYYFKNDRPDSMWWYKLAAIRGDSAGRESVTRVRRE